MKKIIFLFILTLCILFFSLGNAAADEPILPMAFYGSVTINGNPAPAGTEIVAMINDVGKGSIVTTDSGLYGEPGNSTQKLIVEGDVNDFDETINFYIITFQSEYIQANENDVFVNVVENRERDVTELDLSFPAFCGDSVCSGGEDCNSCSFDCGECPPPSGGGPPGGYTPPSCTEEWICTEWSECVDGEQTRTCTDQSDCGTTSDKPDEMRGCVIEEEEPEKICIAGVRVCAGNDLMECSDDETEWDRVETCEFGCSEGKCNTEPESISVTTSGDFLEGLTGYLTGNAVVSLYGLLIFVMIIMGLLFYWKLR